MKRIHLVHVIPGKDLHIFHGYDEIIETIRWGLDHLGFEVTYAINRFEPGHTNVFFGAQMLALDALRRLPASTIIYNLEQISGLTPEQLRESYRYCGEHFQMWDYSEFNLPTWQSFNSARAPVHVPIGYAPILTRIEKPLTQEIDVLFYGGPGGQRLRIFGDLCARLVRTVFVHGLYGRSRDELIAKSRIVINVNQYPRYGIFEIARASYLLANSKAVVSDFSETSKIEPDIRDAVRFCGLDDIVQECVNLLDDDAARTNLEDRGFEIMSARDIRKALERVAIET
jgi:hypothetical protein